MMRVRTNALLSLALIAVCMVLAGPDGYGTANAGTETYVYTGENFHVVSGSRFSAADRVTATFTIDCGLAGGTGDCRSLPVADYAAAMTSFTFTASGSPSLTITSADSEPGYSFILTTDVNGDLGSYSIANESTLEGGSGARIVTRDSDGGFTVARPGAAGGEGRVDYLPGVWRRDSVVPVAQRSSWGRLKVLYR